MYVRPRIEDELLSFGVSGKLWREVLVLYDRQTHSLWSQRVSRAIAGPLADAELDVLPSTVVEWASWQELYPATTVLVLAPSEGIMDSLLEIDLRDRAVRLGVFVVGLAALLLFVLWRRR